MRSINKSLMMKNVIRQDDLTDHRRSSRAIASVCVSEKLWRDRLQYGTHLLGIAQSAVQRPLFSNSASFSDLSASTPHCGKVTRKVYTGSPRKS